MSDITVEGYEALKHELTNAETGKAKLEGEREAKQSQLNILLSELAIKLGVDPKLLTREFLLEKKSAIEAEVEKLKSQLEVV